MYDLTVCAIFRNEAPYLREWIEMHLLVGVEHFFLYDDKSSDAGVDVLRPYVETGVVTLREAPDGRGRQLGAYAECIAAQRNRAFRIAFIDVDEFLFSPTGRDLRDVLATYDAFPAVAVNWCVFGTGGHVDPPDAPVCLSYMRRTTNAMLNRHVKSVVRLDRTRAVVPPDPHHFVYFDGLHAVNEQKEDVRGPFAEPPRFEKLRINHYMSKSEAEARRKAATPRADNDQLRSEHFLLSPALNEIEDATLVSIYGVAISEALEGAR